MRGINKLAPTSRRRLGLLLAGIAAAVRFVPMLAILEIAVVFGSRAGWRLALMGLVMAGAGPAHGALRNLAWRMADESADDIRTIDGRRPVLLLRPFAVDEWFSGRDDIHLSFSTVEENVAEALRVVGPPVALGRPGEALPPIGFHRKYVSSDNWQQAVTDLVRGAELVVLVVGNSPGLNWEVSVIVQSISDPRRLVLAIPSRQADAYELFVRAHSAVFPGGLPLAGQRQVSRFERQLALNAIVTFDEDWRATHRMLSEALLPLGRRFLAHEGFMLRMALKQTCSSIGATWAPPPLAIFHFAPYFVVSVIYLIVRF